MDKHHEHISKKFEVIQTVVAESITNRKIVDQGRPTALPLQARHTSLHDNVEVASPPISGQRAASGKPWALRMLKELSIGQMCVVDWLASSDSYLDVEYIVCRLSPVQASSAVPVARCTGEGMSEDWSSDMDPEIDDRVLIKPSRAATNGERGCEEPTKVGLVGGVP